MIGIFITADPTVIGGLIMQMVGSLGFPIFACLMMFKQNEKLEARHEEESKNFMTAINNNTLAIQKLVDKLGKDEI